MADVLDTFVGSGIVSFKPDGEDDYEDVGECERFATSMEVERKEYISKRTPTRRKVRSVITGASMEVKIRCAEINAANLSRYFLGTVTPPVSPAVYSTIDIGKAVEVIGALRLVGTNSIGQKVQVDLPNVNLAPDGEFDWLSDDWGGLEMTGEVYADNTGSFGLIRPGITAEVTA